MECESDTVINVTVIHAQPVDTNTEAFGNGLRITKTNMASGGTINLKKFANFRYFL